MTIFEVIETLLKDKEFTAKHLSRTRDVIGDVADSIDPDKCRDCGHAKNNPYFHHEAPGTNWGAALHKFIPKA